MGDKLPVNFCFFRISFQAVRSHVVIGKVFWFKLSIIFAFIIPHRQLNLQSYQSDTDKIESLQCCSLKYEGETLQIN